MACGERQVAKRALIKLLLALALTYSVHLQGLTQDSGEHDVLKAYKKLLLKAHPDKGGSVQHAQQLNDLKEAWQKCGSKRGRKKQKEPTTREKRASNKGQSSQAGSSDIVSTNEPSATKGYRIQAAAVLLTYTGVTDMAQWQRFIVFVKAKQSEWKVKYWCITLEACKDGKLHFHLMLQFHRSAERNNLAFKFEGLTPNAKANDLLGEGWGGRRYQESVYRGFFYVWAAKKGTQRDEAGKLCVAGNYWPCWVEDEKCTYPVKGRWNDALWRARKLEHNVYEDYLFLCRDGVVSRNGVGEDARKQKANRAAAVEGF